MYIIVVKLVEKLKVCLSENEGRHVLRRIPFRIFFNSWIFILHLFILLEINLLILGIRFFTEQVFFNRKNKLYLMHDRHRGSELAAAAIRNCN